MEGVQRKTFRLVSARAFVLIALISFPVVVYVVAGTYALWQTNLLIWLWWLVPLFWGLTWLVARFWKTARDEYTNANEVGHWTPRDERAAEIVKNYQQEVDQFSPKELTDPHFYLNRVQSLASELANHYHPRAVDPFSSLTVTEITAAIRLVADDIEHLAINSLPGSRMFTVQQWKSLQHAPKWVKRIRNTAWAAAMLINPFNIARFGAAKATIDPVGSGVQSELLATFYLRLMRQVGFYLIEMNSGRLRGGADAYRLAFDNQDPSPGNQSKNASNSSAAAAAAHPQDSQVTIGLLGQVSSGKSSLINLMVGKSEASVDLLPQTSQVKRYQLSFNNGGDSNFQTEDSITEQESTSVTLLDTPGYGEAGASATQIQQIEQAIVESDIVLLVLDAHSPARSADQQTLQTIEAWYLENPKLKPPPVLAVLTHIDLLSPTMSWAPPYDLDNPASKKGQNIVEAIQYTHEVFEGQIFDVVPVCASDQAERVWGIAEWLMPAIISKLDEAKSIAVLQAFESGLENQSPLKTLLKQAGNSSKQILASWLQKKLNQLNQ